MVGQAITRPPKTPPVPPGTFLPGAESSNSRSRAFAAEYGGEMSRSNSDAGGGVGLGLSTGKKNRQPKEEERAQLPLMQASWGMPPS